VLGAIGAGSQPVTANLAVGTSQTGQGLETVGQRRPGMCCGHVGRLQRQSEEGIWHRTESSLVLDVSSEAKCLPHPCFPIPPHPSFQYRPTPPPPVLLTGMLQGR
jgi:hypothetical protein